MRNDFALIEKKAAYFAMLFILIFTFFLSFAKANPQCADIFVKVANPNHELYTGKVIKTRIDQTHIFELKSNDVEPHYFKEIPQSNSIERQIFDDLEMPVIASRIAHSFGLDTNVPGAILESGIEIILNGSKIKTRNGLFQDGMADLITPIDEFKSRYPNREPKAKDIQEILNHGSWPRIYADWKIFWTIFMQADLNIANLAKHGEDLYMFDTGDLLNLRSIRAEVGIGSSIENLDFNMPDRSNDRVQHRPDFRLADTAFKRMANEIATESDEKTAARLGKSIDDSFLAPRGKVRDHVHEMKTQARWILSLLSKSPFDY